MSAPQCPPILTREQLVARMAYAISPYAWGPPPHPYMNPGKWREKAQANAMKAAEMALREVELAMEAHLRTVDIPDHERSEATAAQAVKHLVVRSVT